MSKKNKSLIFLLTLSLLVTFIYQLNAYTEEIYLISSSEKRISQISQENKILEINLTETNSLRNLNKYVQNFERAGKIEYLRVLEGTALAK